MDRKPRTEAIISVPKSPRWRSDEELYALAGTYAAEPELVELADRMSGSTSWVYAALEGESRPKLIAAVWACFAARLETQRQMALASGFMADLEPEQAESIKSIEPSGKMDASERHRLTAALFTLGGLQRSAQEAQRARLREVREKARERATRHPVHPTVRQRVRVHAPA